MEYQLIESLLPQKELENLSAVERVLINRGIKKEDLKHYLNVSKEDVLPPSSIKNIDEGIKMLIKHISNNDKMFIQIDSDCDGFTSAAIFMNYLNKLFPAYVQNNISYRLHEGKVHGVIIDTVPKDVKIIVLPDSSSNEYEKHRQLKEMGYDILVIDHHEAEKYSNDACVINNQLCDYPTKSLSGAGMVYKFCCRIDELMNTNYAEDMLDIVSLGLK